MQHLVLKAQTVSTDQELGQFEAVVSSWEADRDGDTIEKTAFDKSIEAWQGSGKQLPLLFEHTTQAIGSIDPYSMHPTDAGLVVYGEVDRDTAEGQQVWKQIKSGTASFSIGFMAKSRDTKDGGRVLTEIDLLEISATSTPAHPAARVLGWKSTGVPAVSDKEWQNIFDGFLSNPDSSEDQKDADLQEFIAELEAKSAREAKRNRPVVVKRFEVS